jgi:hypothetical protein
MSQPVDVQSHLPGIARKHLERIPNFVVMIRTAELVSAARASILGFAFGFAFGFGS